MDQEDAALLESYRGAIMPPYTVPTLMPTRELTPVEEKTQQQVKRNLFSSKNVAYSELWSIKKERQKCKRSKYRARKKASKREAWLLENKLKKQWKELKEKHDQERELEIREAEQLATQKREEYANELEEKARLVRLESDAVTSLNDEYIDICSTVEKSDAGSLILSSFQPTNTSSSSSILQNAIYYRNMAEELKRQNRKLHVEMSEKVETVCNFWRNSILEEGTRAGQMVMLAIRKGTT